MQEVTAPVVQEQAVEPVRENVIIETSAKDLLAGMMENKPRAKRYGFYLDDEVVAAPEKSKVLKTLFRNILLK